MSVPACRPPFPLGPFARGGWLLQFCQIKAQVSGWPYICFCLITRVEFSPFPVCKSTAEVGASPLWGEGTGLASATAGAQLPGASAFPPQQRSPACRGAPSRVTTLVCYLAGLLGYWGVGSLGRRWSLSPRGGAASGSLLLPQRQSAIPPAQQPHPHPVIVDRRWPSPHLGHPVA